MQKLISEMDEKLNELQPETKIAGKNLVWWLSKGWDQPCHGLQLWCEKMMLRRESLQEAEIVMGVVSDASPLGLGAMLIQRTADGQDFTVLEAMEATVSYEEAQWFQVQHGSSASRSVMEAYAILRALKRWQARVRGQGVLIRSDSTVALAMPRKLAGLTTLEPACGLLRPWSPC